MASKWNNQTCGLCAQGTLHDASKTVEQQYKGKVFRSSVRGAFCDHCNEGFVEYDESEESAWIAFRNQVDAAQAEELARIRKKLRLTQQEAARLTGGGKNAFSRYERGQAKPVAAVLHLFRLLDKHPDLLGELGELAV